MNSLDTDEYVFFFFQAEDGIRDYKVTGVQTCALPISRMRVALTLTSLTLADLKVGDRVLVRGAVQADMSVNATRIRVLQREREDEAGEIGRASCRERV